MFFQNTLIFIRQHLKPQIFSSRNYVPEYNKRKVSWMARKLNGILSRHPNLLRNLFIFGWFSLFLHAFLSNYYQQEQLKKTMSEEEFLMYQAKKRAVWEQRGKYGTDFYIPYFTKNIAEEQNERTEEIYYKS
ncbi:hypothetical protein ACQ4LE_001960 [Meloidogyne hapla]